MSEVSFTQVVQRGCGIDIHRDEAVATIGSEGLKEGPAAKQWRDSTAGAYRPRPIP